MNDSNLIIDLECYNMHINPECNLAQMTDDEIKEFTFLLKEIRAYELRLLIQEDPTLTEQNKVLINFLLSSAEF